MVRGGTAAVLAASVDLPEGTDSDSLAQVDSSEDSCSSDVVPVGVLGEGGFYMCCFEVNNFVEVTNKRGTR